MKVLLTLLGYLAGTVALVGGLMSGVFWLVQPDASLTREAKAAPIPPRIAESIERKKAPELVAEPVPVKAPMVQANVALTTQSAPKFKIRELSPAPASKRKRRDDGSTLSVSAESPPPVEVRTLSRNDSPY